MDLGNTDYDQYNGLTVILTQAFVDWKVSQGAAESKYKVGDSYVIERTYKYGTADGVLMTKSNTNENTMSIYCPIEFVFNMLKH